jgi:hypothetical protein
MVAGAALALILAAGTVESGLTDTIPGARTASAPGPRVEALRVGVDASTSDMAEGLLDDSVRVRRRAVRLSEAYHTRLLIHKYASYAMLPLFAFQYAAGDQLFKKSSAAPTWARSGHRIGATAAASLFAINSITGSLNWWETRHQEGGRAWRTLHAGLMMLSEAGFVTTGLLAEPAERSGEKRRLHRTVALTSMSVATVSYLMMLKPLRRD